MSGTDIKQLLTSAEYQAIRQANSPSASNPFATLDDIEGDQFGSRYIYSFKEAFDKGVIPAGWTQSTSGAGAGVVYTQAYETYSIGQVQINTNGNAISFASVIYANAINYILNFVTNCVFTKWNTLIRRAPGDVGVGLAGLANNTGSVVPSAFGNVIALVHDPNNMTTANPGLTGNWFVWVKNGVGQSFYNTGIAPTGVWQFVEFDYTSAGVEVKINGAVVVTVPTSDPNLFTSQAPAAGAGLKPVLYTGKGVATAGANSLRVDQFNLYRKWN